MHTLNKKPGHIQKQSEIMQGSSSSKFDYCFRCDANAAIGYGHLNRCLSLASFIEQDKRIAFLMAEPSKYVQNRIKQAGYSLIQIQENKILDAEYIVHDLSLHTKILVFDMSYIADQREQDLLKNYVNKLSKASSVTVIIDSLGLYNVVKTNDWHVDFVLFPYVDDSINKDIGNVLAGSDYVIILKEYIEAKKKKVVSNGVRNILVTFGGSDPSCLTLVVIKALKKITEYDFNVRLIIGGGFDQDLTDSINEKCCAIDNIELIHAPENLIEHMLWADIAVSATGLTKYELSFMQVPSILISIDTEHAQVHQAFSDLGTSTHLGVVSSDTEFKLKNEVIKFIEDQGLLNDMREKSKIYFDGLGAQRVIKRIEENIHAQQTI